jgi:MFS family permease
METASEVAKPAAKPSFFINRNFGLLWIGQAISELGDMIYFVTLSLWVATIIAKGQPWAPAAVSGVMIAVALPALTLGPVAGVFVDRWDKRRTMIRMDMLRALLIFLLIPLTGLVPLPFVTEPFPIFWQIGAIYGVVISASVCDQFFSPARFTILSEILPEIHRARASAMEQTSSSITKIIGPFLAAPLLFVVGVQWALIVNALSFGVSFLAILAVRVPADKREQSESAERASFFDEFKQGVRFYRESRVMLTLFISVLIVTLGTGALDALLVFFFQVNLHAPTSLFGMLPMAIGTGSVLGAILAALLVRRLGSARVFWLTLYLIGVLLILFARQSSLWPALILFLLTGLPLEAINTSLGPLLMHIIPHDLMGRVMSVASTGQTLCNVISVSLAGLLDSLLGGLHANLLGISFGTYDTIYVVTGLLFVLGAFYAMVNLRGLKIPTERQAESQAV